VKKKGECQTILPQIDAGFPDMVLDSMDNCGRVIHWIKKWFGKSLKLSIPVIPGMCCVGNCIACGGIMA
jgi:hypothetical protein